MPEKEIVPAAQILPDKLFIIPLSGKPIFPGIFYTSYDCFTQGSDSG